MIQKVGKSLMSWSRRGQGTRTGKRQEWGEKKKKKGRSVLSYLPATGLHNPRGGYAVSVSPHRRLCQGPGGNRWVQRVLSNTWNKLKEGRQKAEVIWACSPWKDALTSFAMPWRWQHPSVPTFYSPPWRLTTGKERSYEKLLLRQCPGQLATVYNLKL